MSSQTHGIGTGAESSERPRRTIKQSQKAQEILDAGESVPGRPSSNGPKPAFTQPSAGFGMTREPSLSTSSSNMPARKDTAKSAGIAVPTFAAEKFMIYNWQVPRPKSFVDLSDSRKAWKGKVDQQEKARDIDDGSDDWYEFCGDRKLFKDHRGDRFAMEYCIANTFVHHAKRAFWAGKSWQEFEVQERTINSEAQARAEPGAAKRAILLEYALDNNLRLAVFNALKHRLCEEIWLEAYKLSPAVLRLSLPRADSKMPTPSPTVDPNAEQERRAPTTEEMENGITGWSVDGFGVEQPLYGDETELPNGMRNFMRDMREQAQREATARQISGARIGNISVNRLIPMTTAEEIARRDPDFSTSDED